MIGTTRQGKRLICTALQYTLLPDIADFMRLAFVYDRINTWGGAERVLLALHEIWPDAPFFTAVYDKNFAWWAKDLDIRQSFLRHVPFAKTYHELYPWLTPLAFETFTFDAFDVVVSITSAEAKYIITKPKTLHICYCLTPTRYLWHESKQYFENPGIGISSGFVKILYNSLAVPLRRWDMIGSARPDSYIAISKRAEERMQSYYHRTCEKIIYPPVDTKKFKIQSVNSARDRSIKFKAKELQKDYFLVVSRLVSAKRIDLIIDAFNVLGLPLVIIGRGKMRKQLEKRTKGNIQFVSDYLTDDELVRYYGNCRALVHAADEDFGLVAVEAQSCGKPVIAYRNSGLRETVREGVTGLLFSDQTGQSVVQAIQKFTTMIFKSSDCEKNARRFSKEIFQNEMAKTIQQLHLQYRSVNL